MKKPFLSIGEAAAYLGVSIATLRRWHNSGLFPATLLSPGRRRLYSMADLELRSKGLVQLARDWVESPTPYLPNGDWYCATSDVFVARSGRLLREAQASPALADIWSLISSIAGEVGNNAFDHNLGNWPDTPGLFFTYDLGKRLLVLADRGRGLLSTLQPVRPSLATEAQALIVAFSEVVTGRAPEKRGNGLKFVRQIIDTYHFSATFQSGDALLALTGQGSPLSAVAASPIHGCLFILKF